MWQKVYDANYHKSLDHRSFYFKQTDKKSLGAKSMLADIRDIADKRRNQDDGLLAVSAAADFSSRLHADLTYEILAFLPTAHTHCKQASKHLLLPATRCVLAFQLPTLRYLP